MAVLRNYPKDVVEQKVMELKNKINPHITHEVWLQVRMEEWEVHLTVVAADGAKVRFTEKLVGFPSDYFVTQLVLIS